MNNTTFLNTYELCIRWGFHPESIRRMIRQGKIPAVRIGKSLRVSRSEVEALELSRKVIKHAGGRYHD